MSSFKNSWQNRLVFFGRKLKDGIDYSSISYLYFNNNKATDKGIELESNYKKGKWNINANYTYINGVVTTIKYKYNWASASNPVMPNGDTSYNYQFRRPANSINFSAGYQLTKKIYASIQAKVVGKRMEPIYGDSPIAIKGYQVINLYGLYQATKKMQLFADVKNILNTKYIDLNGFTTKPMNFMLGIVVNY
jgi:vitamin B12 transporter